MSEEKERKKSWYSIREAEKTSNNLENPDSPEPFKPTELSASSWADSLFLPSVKRTPLRQMPFKVVGCLLLNLPHSFLYLLPGNYIKWMSSSAHASIIIHHKMGVNMFLTVLEKCTCIQHKGISHSSVGWEVN